MLDLPLYPRRVLDASHDWDYVSRFERLHGAAPALVGAEEGHEGVIEGVDFVLHAKVHGEGVLGFKVQVWVVYVAVEDAEEFGEEFELCLRRAGEVSVLC